MKLTHRRVGKVGEQLREVMLRVEVVSSAGAHRRGENRGSFAAAGVDARRQPLQVNCGEAFELHAIPRGTAAMDLILKPAPDSLEGA